MRISVLTSLARWSVTIFVALWISACGSKSSTPNSSFSSSSSSSSSSSGGLVSTQDFYTECMSTAPINPKNPNQPVITLKGEKVINQPLNSAYIDAGAMASDPINGDISSAIQTIGLDAVDTTTLGDYLIRYTVTNKANLPAAEAVRIVRVSSGAFAAQTARDIGTTAAHMGYYEHLPTHYSDDPNQKYPVIIFQHGWFNARFLDKDTQQAPLSILQYSNLAGIIQSGQWDNTRPFIVLSFQKCVDELDATQTALRTKLFIDYAINTYQIDAARIYMAGHSQGAGDTWNYVLNYPHQLAAIVPLAGYYGNQSGCTLKNTPAWAFNGSADTVVNYSDVVATVDSINACQPAEPAKVTVFKGVGHNDIQDSVFNLSGLDGGLSLYDSYSQNIYDWLLQHKSY